MNITSQPCACWRCSIILLLTCTLKARWDWRFNNKALANNSFQHLKSLIQRQLLVARTGSRFKMRGQILPATLNLEEHSLFPSILTLESVHSCKSTNYTTQAPHANSIYLYISPRAPNITSERWLVLYQAHRPKHQPLCRKCELYEASRQLPRADRSASSSTTTWWQLCASHHQTTEELLGWCPEEVYAHHIFCMLCRRHPETVAPLHTLTAAAWYIDIYMCCTSWLKEPIPLRIWA